MKELTVVCWLWSQPGYHTRYTPEHVAAWAKMIRKNLTLPHRLLCITDNPEALEDVDIETYPLWDEFGELKERRWDPVQRPQCYRRIKVFDPAMVEVLGERFVSIDLDCVVTESLDELLGRADDFIICKSAMPSLNQYVGSMFMMDTGARPEVYYDFCQDAVDRSRRWAGSDQAWIMERLGPDEATFDDADGVYSFRYNVHRLPVDNMKLVFFNGEQNPWDYLVQQQHRWVREHYPIQAADDRTGDVAPGGEYESDAFHLIQRYVSMVGRYPNLQDPQTFNEKMLWRKMYDRRELLVRMTDKLACRTLVKEACPQVSLKPVLYSGPVDEVPELPYPCIIKPNNSSGRTVMVRDRTELERVKAFLEKSKTEPYGVDKGEWTYSHIPFRVMVEPVMFGISDLDTRVPESVELNFYCFHGKCRVIRLFVYRDDKQYQMSHFERNGTFIPVKNTKYDMGPDKLPAVDLGKVRDMAERVSLGLDHVRVDLNIAGGKVYFGEYTLFSGSGHMKWDPPGFDEQLGSWWELDRSTA